MGSINGIDPIIVDNIKVPTQKPAITETQRSKISEDKRDGSKQENQSGHLNKQDLPRLETAVDKLNKLLEQNNISLYFQIVGDHPKIKIQLISADNKKVISEINPAKVFELLANFNTRGFTVDELI